MGCKPQIRQIRYGWLGVSAVSGVSLTRETHGSWEEQVQSFIFTHTSQMDHPGKTHLPEGAAVLGGQHGSPRNSGSVLPDPVFLKTKEEERRKAEKVMFLYKVFSK